MVDRTRNVRATGQGASVGRRPGGGRHMAAAGHVSAAGRAAGAGGASGGGQVASRRRTAGGGRRHRPKTPKGTCSSKRVVLAVLAALLILGAGVAGLAGLVATGNVNVTSASRPENKYTDVLAPHACASDADGDGVDDQTDILSAALRYVQTRPVYRSEYYTGGYPDDGCGVCTDVVAFALRDAGYDLQALVATDITEHPDDYGLDAPDPAIDFRRVRNLKVFFARHAAQLTCDVHAIDEWQGGDIAIFDSHIGIVSDRRNENGVPYLIHHNAPSQLSYEEDVLEGRDDLVMHVRMGCE